MSESLIYSLGELYGGVLIKRYKRLIADIKLNSGEVIVAHCPNTGPMTGVCIPENPVMVSKSDNPKRKLAYTWELIQVGDHQPTWVGINTSLPNRIVAIALQKRLFSQLGGYTKVRREVKYGVGGKSRVDFLLEGDDQLIYLEVKNTTWCQGDVALFPDTVTERGQKHLRELIDTVKGGDRAVMLYFINRGDCPKFAPGDAGDPVYGSLFKEAIAAGVEILPCRFDVTPQGFKYLGLAELLTAN